jgi:hypothetical protein
MRLWRSSRRPRVSGPKDMCQAPLPMSSPATYSPVQMIETLTQRRFQRRPPLALPYRTLRRSGSSRGGR